MEYLGLILGAPREGANASTVFIIQMVAIFAIFYFLLIRPQRAAQKRHQAMLNELKKGDEVVTEGGIVGSVVHIADDHITLKSGESRIVVLRGKIARVGGTRAAADKS